MESSKTEEKFSGTIEFLLKVLFPIYVWIQVYADNIAISISAPIRVMIRHRSTKVLAKVRD